MGPAPNTPNSPTVRVLLVLAAVVAGTLILTVSSAGAQDVVEVPLGDSFSIENGNECRSNGEVLVTLIDAVGRDRLIGSSIADRNGHFAIEATLPATAAPGAAVLSVDCGIPDGLLVFEIQLVEPESVDLISYATYALVAAAVGLLLLLGLRHLRRGPGPDPASGTESESTPSAPHPAHALSPEAAPAPNPAPEPNPPAAPRVAPVPTPTRPESSQDDSSHEPDGDDDDADYWIWDNETQAGPVKRLACLSRTSLYLHEVALSELPALLDQLAAVGPEVALATAFVAVPIADVVEVRHHGNHLKITYRNGSDTLSRTIDLGTEVDSVVELLSQRVPVLADAAFRPS